MKAVPEGRTPWCASGCYPVEERLAKGFKADEEGAVLLVDVGGGIGADMERFRKRYPDMPGKVIVQDLPDVINSTKMPQGVEGMAHDFFTPQPVKGKALNNKLPSVRFSHFRTFLLPTTLSAEV